MDQAIVACSTPPGRGAISIVRISGKEAKSIINNLFSLEFDHGASKVAETSLSEGFNEKCLISCFEGPYHTRVRMLPKYRVMETP